MAFVAASGPVFSRRSRFRDFAARFAESKVAVAALAVLVLILLAAFLSPWIAPTDPYDLVALDILDSRLPPGSTSKTSVSSARRELSGRGAAVRIEYATRSPSGSVAPRGTVRVPPGRTDRAGIS